jgi:hypothetical protein
VESTKGRDRACRSKVRVRQREGRNPLEEWTESAEKWGGIHYGKGKNLIKAEVVSALGRGGVCWRKGEESARGREGVGWKKG